MRSPSSQPEHVQQRPERAAERVQSTSPFTYPLWVKHVAAQRWCIAVEILDSVCTACRGRWDADDEWTISADPPENERCGGCELERMRRKRVSGNVAGDGGGLPSAAGAAREPATFSRIEAGLAELAANACICDDVPSLRHLDADGHLSHCPQSTSGICDGLHDEGVPAHHLCSRCYPEPTVIEVEMLEDV